MIDTPAASATVPTSALPLGSQHASRMDLTQLGHMAQALRQQMGQAVVGQAKAVDLLLVALLSQGHVLLEGPPGTAKTLMARSLAACLSCDFGRIQFTPDLMPGDVLGTNLFDFQSNAFRLIKGPVFADIVLADEINRAPPKTQAALLQAMNERRITIDDVTHDLGANFTVIATQNPIEQQGTYPLPEAQLDRFLFQVLVDYPSEAEERQILSQHLGSSSDGTLSNIEAIVGPDALQAARDLIGQLYLDQALVDYIITIIRATRSHPALSFGASTRAADALANACRSFAALDGRDYVIPDDVKLLVVPAIAHRLVLSPSAEIEGRTTGDVLAEILANVEAPRTTRSAPLQNAPKEEAGQNLEAENLEAGKEVTDEQTQAPTGTAWS